MFSLTIYLQNPMYTETMEADDQKIRMNSSSSTKVNGVDQDNDDDEDDVTLPGFRFHPTDEELVGFYLRRKVERKPISIELIKQIDIYKYDPWDLPKASNVGDKEWYFFCKRGRKYRNSIRPNRVTGSGFWKATGIDRPIYSGGGEGRDCIGLKKSLVYYRGSAGKGTKTDWMMHEFRLPVDHHEKSIKHLDVKVKPVSQEAAEVWTLCRIFKRNVSYRKCMPDWKESSSRRMNKTDNSSSKTCSDTFDSTEEREKYISFNNPAVPPVINMRSSINDMKPFISNNADQINRNEFFVSGSFSQEAHESFTSNYNNNSIPSSTNLPDFFVKQGDWDELSSVMDMHNNVMGLDFNQF